MTKVLLTGGSGFIAAHILQQLLEKGHSVVTTVRTEDKAKRIHEAYPDLGEDRLKTLLVPDIAREDAFDQAVLEPGIEVVLHTASPFHFRVTDPKKDLIDPAVIGTTAILRAIKRSAPQVRRVVVTSSFAAILDPLPEKLRNPATVFTEKDWNSLGLADVGNDAGIGYRVSKTLAEKAAWEFVAEAKPNFDLVTVNPPMVFGPIVHHLEGVAAINTSNERFIAAITGLWKEKGDVPDSGLGLTWVDVRDVARAHILGGLEIPEAGGKRLFTASGMYSNRDIYDIIRTNFPEYVDRLPPTTCTGGYPPKDCYSFDNSATSKILGIKWIPLEKSVVDTVNSLKKHVE